MQSSSIQHVHADWLCQQEYLQQQAKASLSKLLQCVAGFATPNLLQWALCVASCQLHVQVCRSLIELGVNFELEKFLADGCHTIDIVLRIPGKPRSVM